CLRPDRDHDVVGQERTADGRVGVPADRLADHGGGVFRPGRVVAAGAGRGGRGGVSGRPRGGGGGLAPRRVDGVAVCHVPIRRGRCARNTHVPHRGSGVLGRGRAAAVSRARG